MQEFLRILQIHNQYASGLGGEDTVLELEKELLVTHGHQVNQYVVSNGDVTPHNSFQAIKVGISSIWSWKHYLGLREAIRAFKPDLAHIHNVFAALSPSVFWACKKEEVPVVLTLHNYRLICSASNLFRNGEICLYCVDNLPFAAFTKNCRNGNSRGQALSIMTNILFHRAIGTYRKKVDAFITLSDYGRVLFSRVGIPKEKIWVKPNFVQAPTSLPLPLERRERTMVFLGQTSAIKGLDSLLEAWCEANTMGWTLLVIGDGVERASLQERFSWNTTITWKGWLPREEAMKTLEKTRWLVFPSRCHEGMPMTILEAFSRRTPVIVPRQRAFSELVREDHEGILFDSDSQSSFVEEIEKAINMKDEEWNALSYEAYKAFETKYSPKVAFDKLISVYRAIL